MATLQKIRNHGVALLVIVGLAMLAFILGDFLNSGSSFFNRSRENVGRIAGHDVHYTEYEAAKEQLTEVYKIETGRSDFDEELSSQIRNQVWQMMLMDYSLRAEGKKIGMDVTADELSELCIGEHPHELIAGRRAFFDETGSFNRDYLVRFLASLEQDAETPEQAANLKQAKNYWMYWEHAVRLTCMQEKYTNLLQSLIKANSIDAKYAFNARQESVSAEYVMQPFYAVADSLVKVSNSDIKKLYAQHKKEYKQTPNRAIAYVAFDIKPSEQDFADTKKLMEDLQEEFKTTDDVALVVNTNSDIMYDGRDYSETTIPEQYKDFAFAKGAKAGDVTELRFADDTYSMARLMQVGYSLPDSVCLKAIASQEGQEDTELGWFTADKLNKNIAEPAFAGKRGTRFTVAQGLGEQTFEIVDISAATPKAKVAILERNVTPSSKTYSVIYNNAKQFIVNNPTEDAFRAAAAERGLAVHPQFSLNKNTEKVADLKASRAIVRWAFDAKEGQVSDVFECGNQFVVAVLTEANDGEYRSLDAVRSELTVEATNNKKAEYIKKQLAGITSLQEAAEILGKPVQTAENVTLASFRFGNAGNEPAVIGTALALAEGELSEPIQGRTGVFVLKAGAKTVAEGELDVETEKQQLVSRVAYMIPYQAIALIQEQADVEDNRANFQ